MAEFFLGFDFSTQSLTGIIIDYRSKQVIYRENINYGDDLSLYKYKNGIIVNENSQQVHSNPLMWIEALELFFQKLFFSEINVKSIKAISGSAQQHGTVYLNNKFEEKVNNLDPNTSLVDQLKDSLSRETSPIWMDSSTTKQCKEIREKLGGKKKVIILTGSDTFERFSGPQIRKFYQQNPQKYGNTKIIHLISSFLASILTGKKAPIDYGDGAGMNLMNIKQKIWDENALNATAPNLKEKLPPLTESYKIIGNISQYFIKKYNFSPETKIIAWSGDNPNSLIGTGLIKRGRFAFSLGTSDTYFGYLQKLQFDMKGEGHIFGAPTGDYMSLICFKNGSLAREKIKDDYNLTWEEFSNILNKTIPGNYGRIMLPYFFPEIVPIVLQPKVFRFGFDENDMEANIRAIIEAQFLSMRLHSDWIEEKPKKIYATGGASANKEILQIAADIFKTPIIKYEITDSAALGAAFRATYSYYITQNSNLKWERLIDSFMKEQKQEKINPTLTNGPLYDDMLQIYDKFEKFVLKNAENPEIYRKEFIQKYY